MNLPSRCCHLISRVAHRAYFLDEDELQRRARSESEGLRRYDKENLLWQFTVAIKLLTMLVPSSRRGGGGGCGGEVRRDAGLRWYAGFGNQGEDVGFVRRALRRVHLQGHSDYREVVCGLSYCDARMSATRCSALYQWGGRLAEDGSPHRSAAKAEHDRRAFCIMFPHFAVCGY